MHTAYMFRHTRLDLTNITSTYLGIVMIGIQNVNYLVITIANKIQRIKEKNNKQIEKLRKKPGLLFQVFFMPLFSPLNVGYI